jgi:hypothetical protein
MHAEKIAALRASLTRPGLEEASIRIPLGHSAADLCLKGGLERGVLHEVFAAIGHEAVATGFVAGLAARVAMGKRLLWIRQDFSALEFGELSATGFLEFGLDPARLLLLCVADAAGGLRAANDALSCDRDSGKAENSRSDGKSAADAGLRAKNRHRLSPALWRATRCQHGRNALAGARGSFAATGRKLGSSGF